MLSWLSRHRQSIVQIAGTLLAIVLLVLLLREGGWEGILAAMQKIRVVDLLWVAVLFIISRVATVCRWHVLLRSADVNIRFKDSLALTFTGLFASNFLPTTIGGDVVRLAGAMQMGFDRAVCLASIAADRLIGLLGMLMTLPIGIFYSWNILSGTPLDLSFVGFVAKPLAFIKRTLATFSIWLQKPGSLFLSLLFTWVHMLCVFGSIYVFTKDLGSHVSFWMIAGLWSLTYFITLIPISINGYGLQELSFTFLFSHVAGVSPTMSLTVVVLIRAYLVISSLPGAFLLPSALAAMTDQQASSPKTVF
ncbi:MAG: lysylphosphatidylglycerol synthase transmembrane domain-containing protein [Chloroflexota bacterium]